MQGCYVEGVIIYFIESKNKNPDFLSENALKRLYDRKSGFLKFPLHLQFEYFTL